MENDTTTTTTNTNTGFGGAPIEPQTGGLAGLLLIVFLVTASVGTGYYLGTKNGLAKGEWSACTKITSGITRLATEYIGPELALSGASVGCLQENGTTYFKATYEGRVGKAPLDFSSFTITGEAKAPAQEEAPAPSPAAGN